MTNRTFLSGRVLLGVVTSPHGLRGQFKVKSFTDPPANLIDYGDVMLPTGQSLKLELVGSHKDLLICGAQEIKDRTAAEAIQKQELSVSRKALPVITENEIYQTDYIGFMVIDLDKNPIGLVVGFHNFGAGDIIEVKPEGLISVLFPFTGFLERVILKEKQLVMNIPNGFLD